MVVLSNVFSIRMRVRWGFQPPATSPSLRVCLLFLLYWNPLAVNATVYTHNETGRVAAYPSLPALFGEPFLEGRLYEGVLQYLVENPFLCEAIDFNTTSFVNRSFPIYSGAAAKGEPTEEERPIVMLAARGDCPFHFKAMAAESLGPSVQFLIIYNHNLDGEDVLVPMYSEYGTSRLKLLSVTHRTGTALKRYIADYQGHHQQEAASTTTTTIATGPVVSMDSMPPEGVMTAQDLQDVLVSTLGLFFMLVSFSGCFLMCAAAAQHGRRHGAHDNGRRASPLWMLLMGDPDTDTDPAVAARGPFGRTLLTTEEVQEFLINRSSTNINNNHETRDSSSAASSAANCPLSNDSSTQAEASAPSNDSQPQGAIAPGTGDSPNYTHCAICIDDFDENSTEPILKLPCNHAFHTDCIVPWLTERQSKCPLCKYDVLGYVQELAAEQPATTLSQRWRRHDGLRSFPGSWFSFYTPVNQGQEGTRPATSTELEMTPQTEHPSTTTTTTTLG